MSLGVKHTFCDGTRSFRTSFKPIKSCRTTLRKHIDMYLDSADIRGPSWSNETELKSDSSAQIVHLASAGFRPRAAILGNVESAPLSNSVKQYPASCKCRLAAVSLGRSPRGSSIVSMHTFG